MKRVPKQKFDKSPYRLICCFGIARVHDDISQGESIPHVLPMRIVNLGLVARQEPLGSRIIFSELVAVT